jgi:hypothetical protein
MRGPSLLPDKFQLCHPQRDLHHLHDHRRRRSMRRRRFQGKSTACHLHLQANEVFHHHQHRRVEDLSLHHLRPETHPTMSMQLHQQPSLQPCHPKLFLRWRHHYHPLRDRCRVCQLEFQSHHRQAQHLRSPAFHRPRPTHRHHHHFLHQCPHQQAAVPHPLRLHRPCPQQQAALPLHPYPTGTQATLPVFPRCHRPTLAMQVATPCWKASRRPGASVRSRRWTSRRSGTGARRRSADQAQEIQALMVVDCRLLVCLLAPREEGRWRMCLLRRWRRGIRRLAVVVSLRRPTRCAMKRSEN